MYMLFAGDTYYPCGGINDYKGLYRNLEEAYAFLIKTDYDWYQIVNDTTFEVVEKGSVNSIRS